MSLDVYLKSKGNQSRQSGTGIFIREDGRMREISPVVYTGPHDDDEVYSANITHNLNTMASEAGIYEHLWRPDEIGISTARQLIGPLTEGLKRLKGNRSHFEQFNPSNGWGDYDGLVEFVESYIVACEMWPDAEVLVWR